MNATKEQEVAPSRLTRRQAPASPEQSPAPEAARVLPISNGLPAEARAGTMFGEQSGSPDIGMRARMSVALQQNVGNARMGRMLRTVSPPIVPPETVPAAQASPQPAAEKQPTEAPAAAIAATPSAMAIAAAPMPLAPPPAAPLAGLEAPVGVKTSPAMAARRGSAAPRVEQNNAPAPVVTAEAQGEPKEGQGEGMQTRVGAGAASAAPDEPGAPAAPAQGAGTGGSAAAAAEPPAGPASGGGMAKTPAAQVDGSSSESILRSLASAPASAFADSLRAAKSATPAVQSREREQVEQSYPEIERPTGIPAGPGPRKPPAPSATGAQPKVGAPSGDGGGTPAPAQTEVATGPVPGADAPAGGGEPPAPADGGDGGSWWDWLTSRLQSLLASLPTTDSGLSTSAGARPQVDTGGAANPAQNEAIAASGKAQVESQQMQADAATALKFGENDIAPTVPGGKMRPSSSKGGAPGGTPSGGKSAAALPDDMRAQFDAARGPSLQAGVGQQMAQHRQEQANFAKESQNARQDGEHRVAAENERARAEQVGLKQAARADVDAERERWRVENRKVLQTYAEGTQAKRADTEKQIDDKLKATDKSVDDKFTEAETNAEQQKVKAEQGAAQKRADVENKPHSFWDRVKGAVSSFFDEVKHAITGIFTALRSAVKKLIDEAKTLVHQWIEAARQFVIGLIKAFGEMVKAAISVALAAFPELAKRARDWIDRHVDEAVDAVNRVANALAKAIDAILDAVAKALDAALRALQAAYLAILDALEALADAVVAVMGWLGKLAELLKKFGAFLKGLEELIATGAEKILNEAKKTLEGYINQIPGKAQSLVQEHAKDFGKTAEKHVQGIWRHLQPALLHLEAHWWDEVKQMAWNLVWPFNEKSPIWKDVPAIIKLPGKIASSLLNGKVSEGIDEYLELAQKLNSLVGVFYGWFFIASVLVGATIGAFFGGAGAIPGAIAGAAFAGEVGEGLLAVMVATETAVIVKAAYDLAFGPGTPAVNESAYDRIANSTLTLAITGVMVLLGELAADLAKAITDGVKGLFKEGAEVPKGELPKGEEPELPEPGEADIAAKAQVEGGGEVEITKDGECLVCASPCAVLRQKYQTLLADPDPALGNVKTKLNAADQIADPVAKAKAEAEVTADLADIQKVLDWEKSGKITGDLADLKKRLGSSNQGTRLGARAELIEFEEQIATGKTPDLRGGRKGTDLPDIEIKARTEPFIDENNAQNFFNNRIKAANEQLKGAGSQGRVVINLGDNANIAGKPIDTTVARELVEEALAKGGRGTNVTEVVVKDGKGQTIYQGSGK